MSLAQLSVEDGALLRSASYAQRNGSVVYPVDEAEYRRYTTHRVRRAEKDVSVTVPVESAAETVATPQAETEVRESIRIQALVV